MRYTEKRAKKPIKKTEKGIFKLSFSHSLLNYTYKTTLPKLNLVLKVLTDNKMFFLKRALHAGTARNKRLK